VNQDPYSVSIVVDRNYGQLLRTLIASGPVWIVGSPANRESSQQLWDSSPTRTHLEGITLFKAADTSSPEEMLVGWMDTIELHHGVYSADPPYTAVRVIGATATPHLREVLGTFGFDSFTLTDEGFRAVRPLAAARETDERGGETS
jgi:hypothetical protein